MEFWILVLLGCWPVIGLVVLSVLDRALMRRGKRLPPATTPVEVLLRMYLWPLVWLRIIRALRGEAGRPDRDA